MIKEDRMREGGREGRRTRREEWRWKEGVRVRRTGENLKLIYLSPLTSRFMYQYFKTHLNST